MKSYQVEITSAALADLEELYHYIAIKLQSPENAIGQYDRIAESILKLNSMPERYRIMDSEPEHSRGMRVMPVDNYYVVYIIKEKKVVVTNILYSASDIHERLKG